MICSNEIPEKDGYYWVKLSPSWKPQVIEYVKGIVYIMGSNLRYSPYEDVYYWYDRIEEK